MKQLMRIIIGAGLLILVLSYLEFREQRAFLLSDRYAHPEVKVTSAPVSASAGEEIELEWEVIARKKTTVKNTGIYYDFESSPSAATKKDSPDTLSYQFKLVDYQNGEFFVPDQFQGRIIMPEKNDLYLRAYAESFGEYIWSDEIKIELEDE